MVERLGGGGLGLGGGGFRGGAQPSLADFQPPYFPPPFAPAPHPASPHHQQQAASEAARSPRSPTSSRRTSRRRSRRHRTRRARTINNRYSRAPSTQAADHKHPSFHTTRLPTIGGAQPSLADFQPPYFPPPFAPAPHPASPHHQQQATNYRRRAALARRLPAAVFPAAVRAGTAPGESASSTTGIVGLRAYRPPTIGGCCGGAQPSLADFQPPYFPPPFAPAPHPASPHHQQQVTNYRRRAALARRLPAAALPAAFCAGPHPASINNRYNPPPCFY
ncbi:WUSCHEL-related homeobox 7-like [Ostrinia furnacalis]|uniref:WUSCHEL-related homeobox 7-like n=1 Tax=Ostrinia furnacalis TaxID=93504 RepID=UPI00103B8A88|nr:WUSCHEL-related homeobox 7-like [Ostrinia furnacalis]